VGRQDEEHAVADTEPPAPAGLGDLSASLRAIADFLEIDKDLIAVAAETSPPLEEPANDGLAEWITTPPAAEKDTPLTMVADGEGARVQALLLRASAEVIQPPRKAIESRAQPGEPNVTNIIRRIEFRRLDS
jgi:hypothetical protein